VPGKSRGTVPWQINLAVDHSGVPALGSDCGPLSQSQAGSAITHDEATLNSADDDDDVRDLGRRLRDASS
jgi:hypothetical protein